MPPNRTCALDARTWRRESPLRPAGPRPAPPRTATGPQAPADPRVAAHLAARSPLGRRYLPHVHRRLLRATHRLVLRAHPPLVHTRPDPRTVSRDPPLHS